MLTTFIMSADDYVRTISTDTYKLCYDTIIDGMI